MTIRKTAKLMNVTTLNGTNSLPTYSLTIRVQDRLAPNQTTRKTTMPSYDIEIIETASKIVTVEADSESEAVRLVNDKYRNQDILLDASDGDVNYDYEIKPYRDDVDEDD
ncbi:hypothetical protein FEF33_14450 (plasmid) [Moraxella osloensis]|nr:hypothetical protein FEF33_14450 [Moraxella osloensis]